MDQVVQDKFATRVDELRNIRFCFSESFTPSWGTCELVFDVKGEVTVWLQNKFTDRELTYGQFVILARELGIDIHKLNRKITSKEEDKIWHPLIALPSMVEDLRHLCAYVNTYFIQLAALHLGVEKKNCLPRDGHVVTKATLLPQGIPYKLLIELELHHLFHKTNQPQVL